MADYILHRNSKLRIAVFVWYAYFILLQIVWSIHGKKYAIDMASHSVVMSREIGVYHRAAYFCEAHKMAFRKRRVNASFWKRPGEWPMKI